MKYEEMLEKVGEFGRYQKRIFALLMFPSMTVGAFTMMVIVAMYTPNHRCKIPGLENDTFAIQSRAHERLVNNSIPGSTDPTLMYDTCNLYKNDSTAADEHNLPINASLAKCHEWVYDKAIFYETFTSKTNLVCSNAMKTSHIQMSLFFGYFVGAFALGNAADVIGRKKVFYFGALVMVLAAVSISWAPGVYSFAALQFIIGASSHGSFLSAVVLCMEIVGPSRRSLVGMLTEVFFSIGICYLALMAFLIRTWFWIHLSITIPCFVYLAYWWFIPESPRWLISTSKHDQAVDIIRKLAKVNKAPFPEHLNQVDTGKNIESNGKIWDVFRNPVLFRRTMILAFNWMIVSMTYYGVTMNAGNMAGDFYLNFFLMGLAEIPGLLIGFAMLDRIGRRWANSGSMIIGGVACLATMPTVLWGTPDLQPLTLALAFIGKAGAASAFGIVYIFTAELLPTVIRNAAMGSCSCAARIGGMLAPYIAKSGELIGGKFGQVEPLVIFGSLSIIAGLMLLLLPETLNYKLPDTIQEGEQFGRKLGQPDTKDIEIPFISDKNDR